MTATVPDTKPALLKCSHVWASYDGVPALENVSIELQPGEIIGLCGPNKAGKSTLAACIAGIKSLDSGKIRWQDRDLTTISCEERFRAGIFFCPEWRGLYPGMTVRENLAVGAGSISSARLQQRLDVVLNYFPLLAKRMQQSAGTLSGGEARVLAIAKKLMPMETDSGGHPTLPYLLILDEASSGLSPVFIHTLFETMRTISRDSGVAILLVEEGLSRLSSWVQRAYVLERRRLIAEGSVSDLEQNKDVASAFGGAL